MKFLQFNLGRGKEAQDLLMQTARERRADVLLIDQTARTNGLKTLLGTRLHHGGLGSLFVARI